MAASAPTPPGLAPAADVVVPPQQGPSGASAGALSPAAALVTRTVVTHKVRKPRMGAGWGVLFVVLMLAVLGVAVYLFYVERPKRRP